MTETQPARCAVETVVQFPEDCGGPHKWERMTGSYSCGCVLCNENWHWLECAHCLATWMPDGDAWTLAWQNAQ